MNYDQAREVLEEILKENRLEEVDLDGHHIAIYTIARCLEKHDKALAALAKILLSVVIERSDRDEVQ